jgi:hypothetical protein
MERREALLERVVEHKLVAWTKAHNGLCVKLADSGNGMPDRLLLLPEGKVRFVELKRPGGKPRLLQTLVHRKLRDLGYLVYVIDNDRQFDDIQL